MALETPAAIERQQRLERRSQRKLFNDNIVESSALNLSTKDTITESVVSALDIGREEEICVTMESVVLPVQVPQAEPGCSSKSTQVDHEHMCMVQ